jgi:peptidoglycan/LPS O-acetylase OafA/YrhL
MDLRSWHSIGAALAFLLPVMLLVALLAAGSALAYRGVTYSKLTDGSTTEIGITRRLWLFAMGATFGVTLGCFMGASQSMPASNILNLLVPLVSGYIAYMTSRDLAPEIRLFVPGMVSILLLALLITFWHMKYYFAPTA